MIELNDKEFDAAFRKRVSDADLRFDEAAWDKMADKLRRRDRIVLFRKLAVAALLLLIGFAGYDYFDKYLMAPAKPMIAHQMKDQKHLMTDPLHQKREEDKHVGKVKALSSAGLALSRDLPGVKEVGARLIPSDQHLMDLPELKLADYQISARAGAVSALDTIRLNNTLAIVDVKDTATAASSQVYSGRKSDFIKKLRATEHAAKNRRPMSLALSAGPEFNSSSALLGGKTGFNAGLSFSMGVAKRLKLQAGLLYSAKDYITDGFSYHFKNPKFKDMIAEVDASCAVLEIPLLASYTVMEDRSRSIDVNAGVSSYMMLKEAYTFNYNPQSGIPDRLVNKKDANQHYFSVLNLSATYFIKLKTEQFKIGLEPYVKVPLGGVGEGKVNLKSSGVAVKLQYDLRRIIR